MALHPGETGICAEHGRFDEFCEACTQRDNAKRASSVSLYAIDQKLKQYELNATQRETIIEMVRQFGLDVGRSRFF